MSKIYCYDSNGNTIDLLTQWDTNQKIYIKISDEYTKYITNNPKVHFCNEDSDRTYIVNAKKINNNTISAQVPNSLLTQSFPIFAYIYFANDDNTESKKTIAFVEIPIRKRAKPEKYIFNETIENITIAKMKQDVKDAINDTIQEVDYIKKDLISSVISFFDEGGGSIDILGRYHLSDDGNGNLRFVSIMK